MNPKSILVIFLCLSSLFLSASIGGESFYITRPADPGAMYLTKEDYPVHADGIGDDSDAIQQAIDQASGSAARCAFCSGR